MAAEPSPRPWPTWLLLAWLGLLLLFPAAPGDQPRTDALRYLQISREMAEGGGWLVPRLGGEPYFQKPPLLFWLNGAVLAALGDSPGARRVVLTAAGIACLLLCWRLGRDLWGERAGVLAALALAATALFLREGRTVRFAIPLLSLQLLALWLGAAGRTGWKRALGFWAVLAAGVLLKGPIGLVPLPVVLLVAPLRRDGRFIRHPAFWAGGPLVLAVLALPWLLVMLHRHGQPWLAAVGRELESRFAPEGPADRWSLGEVAWFQAERLLAYGWPSLAALPVAAWTLLRRSPLARPGTGRALVLAWGGTVFLVNLWLRPPYNRYLIPLLGPLALAAGRALDLHLPAGFAASWGRWWPRLLGGATVLLLVAGPPATPAPASDALLFRELLDHHGPRGEPLPFFQGDLAQRRRSWEESRGRPMLPGEIVGELLWSQRLQALYFLRRELAPMSRPEEVLARPPGTLLVAGRSEREEWRAIPGLEVLLRGREWVLLRRCASPCAPLAPGR